MVAYDPTSGPVLSEDEIADFCDDVVNSHHKVRTVLRRPVLAYQVWRAVSGLPALACDLSKGERDPFDLVLHRPAPWPVRDLLAFRSVLEVPDQEGAYMAGRARQTLRRKARIAQRAGITVTEVRLPEERRRLLALTVRREQAHPILTYRNDEPELGHLLEVDLWLLASAEDGRPVLIVVSPIAGEWGMLSYFRTLEDGDIASAARYLMSAELVEHLRRRSVRFLLDPASPFRLPSGLRHFQRMLGWRFARVRPTRRNGHTSPALAAEPSSVERSRG